MLHVSFYTDYTIGPYLLTKCILKHLYCKDAAKHGMVYCSKELYLA